LPGLKASPNNYIKAEIQVLIKASLIIIGYYLALYVNNLNSGIIAFL
jgi:hypothetical protein